jgi:hypothetical protein
MGIQMEWMAVRHDEQFNKLKTFSFSSFLTRSVVDK